jgi:hypothetical protein
MAGWNVSLYNAAITEASKSALVEVFRILSSYSDYFVLGGGWAPYYIIECFSRKTLMEHCGSMDIDLIMDPKLRETSRYETIVEMLEKRGYHQHVENNHRFLYKFDKTVISPVDGKPYDISLDFITEPPETELQQGLVAAGIKGISIGLNHYFNHSIRGILPGNGETIVDARILDVVGCLVTKGLAMQGRYKEKDPYDVYTVVTCYKAGPQDAAKEFKMHMTNPTVKDALEYIQKQFESENSEGPHSVARFMFPGNPEAQSRTRLDAFMRLSEFFRYL